MKDGIIFVGTHGRKSNRGKFLYSLDKVVSDTNTYFAILSVP